MNMKMNWFTFSSELKNDEWFLASRLELFCIFSSLVKNAPV